MADGIEKIKTELLELSIRYSTLRQVEDSNASSLAELLKLMVKEEMTQSSDTENNTTVMFLSISSYVFFNTILLKLYYQE